MSDNDPEQRRKEAEEAVQRRVGRRVKGLRLEIIERGVILHGQAISYHAKQLAQHAAGQELGLPVVANRIDVCLNLAPPDPGRADLDG